MLHSFVISKLNFLTSRHDDLILQVEIITKSCFSRKLSRLVRYYVNLLDNDVDLSDNDINLLDNMSTCQTFMATCQIILFLSVWH